MPYDGVLKWFSKESKFFNLRVLRNLLKKGLKVPIQFINLIIKCKGKKGIPLLNLIFQYTNYDLDIIFMFLLHYLNKKPLSNSELKNIITLENKKLNDLFTTNGKYNRKTFGKGYKFNKSYAIDYNDEGNSFNRTYTTEYNYFSFDIGMVYSETLAIFLVEKGLNINNFKYKKFTTFYRNHIYNTFVVTRKEETISPLIIYFMRGNEFLVKYLIDHGVNVNCDYKCSSRVINKYDNECFDEYYYKTLLSMACEEGNESLVKYLIDHGADVNVQCYQKGDLIKNKKTTPLTIAREKGHEFLIKYLIDHGAKGVNEKNN